MSMWAVLDDAAKAAIALCWHEIEAQRIVDAMNARQQHVVDDLLAAVAASEDA
jgi:hypothetical protein